jgi:hypothetical protein
MAILLLIIAAIGCLSAGIALKQLLLVWIALAICALGLALSAGLMLVRQWSRTKRSPADRAAESAGECSPDVSPGVGAATSPADQQATEAPRAEVTSTQSGDGEPGALPDVIDEPARPRHEAAENPAAAALVTVAAERTTDLASGGSRQESGQAASAAGGNEAGRPEQVLTTESIVCVLPRRRRYHRPGCRLIARNQPQQVTLGEAQEENFTACTVCIGDSGT